MPGRYRNAPTATYAAFSPKHHWNTSDALLIGGIFWDGRASGQPSAAMATGPELDRKEPTGEPLADQTKGPFLNPVEMRLTTLEEVVGTVLASKSGKLFLKIYGKEVYDRSGLNVPLAYNKIAEAIAAFFMPLSPDCIFMPSLRRPPKFKVTVNFRRK
jgi:cytochrome c peroxidase